MNNSLTIEMLERYLYDCQNPEPIKDTPTPEITEPSLLGFYFWCKEH